MEGTYSIWLGREEVGQASVERRGLYYYFYCRCRLHSEVMCRVTVSCGGVHENLGILLPVGTEYVLSKKLSVKQFRPGIPEFWITAKQPQMREIYIDVYPEEPFRYIAKLEKAYLDKRRGKSCIRLPAE